MKSVIFLDIDGVLNHEGTRTRIGSYRGLEVKLVARLASLVVSLNADIVVTSTWWRMGDFGPSQLNSALRASEPGCLVADRVIDKVPDRFTCEERLWTRGDEIHAWLRDNPVTSFVILDDMDIGRSDLMPYLILTDPQVGLQEADVRLAETLLEI